MNVLRLGEAPEGVVAKIPELPLRGGRTGQHRGGDARDQYLLAVSRSLYTSGSVDRGPVVVAAAFVRLARMEPIRTRTGVAGFQSVPAIAD